MTTLSWLRHTLETPRNSLNKCVLCLLKVKSHLLPHSFSHTSVLFSTATPSRLPSSITLKTGRGSRGLETHLNTASGDHQDMRATVREACRHLRADSIHMATGCQQSMRACSGTPTERHHYLVTPSNK